MGSSLGIPDPNLGGSGVAQGRAAVGGPVELQSLIPRTVTSAVFKILVSPSDLLFSTLAADPNAL